MFKVAVEEEFNHIPQITAEMRSKLSAHVTDTCGNLETRIKVSMQEPKSGRVYKRGGDKVHIASASGEAPAVDYGHLFSSIQQKSLGPMSRMVYTNADYAETLEFGGAHMKKRPFMIPAAVAEWQNFVDEAKRILGSL